MKPSSLLSGHDALTLLEIEFGSLHCRTEADFTRLFTPIGKLFSFDFTFSMLGYRHDRAVVFIDAVNISYPPDFFRQYKAKNGLQIDLIANQNFTNYAVQYWSVDKKRSAQPQEMVSLAVDFGMKTGYVHGAKLFGFQPGGSFFAFSGPALKFEPRTSVILELMIPYLHLCLTELHAGKQVADSRIVLSNREREVLNWVRHGKSSWDISVILGISESTVNFHIYNSMRKLGAVNRSQMVAAATRLGLVDLN